MPRTEYGSVAPDNHHAYGAVVLNNGELVEQPLNHFKGQGIPLFGMVENQPPDGTFLLE